MSAVVIVILVLLIILAIIGSYVGIAYKLRIWPFKKLPDDKKGDDPSKGGNDPGTPGKGGSGLACNTGADCKDKSTACCKGVCQKMVDGWCPGEGANKGSDIGGSCKISTDCKHWGHGIGGKGVTCCYGTCTAKKDLIGGGLICKYPRGTWLAAWDVPNASKLCASGKTYTKGLDVFCA